MDKITQSCFVIMPFGGWFDKYYQSIFAEAITSSGFDSQRADDIARPGNIVSQIIESMKNAEVILADLTDSNPNVYYELGFAHCLKKPTVLVTTSIDDIPFDLRSLRIIEYDKNDPHWGENLKAKITNHLTQVRKAPEKSILKFGQ